MNAAKTEIDRKILPALSTAPDIKFPEVQRAKLKNGLNVILLERHSAPIVNVALAVDAGYASDSPQKPVSHRLRSVLLDEGTKTRDTFQIVNQLDSLGARLNTGSSLDMSFVRLQATAENLKPSLGIMADVVLNPAFPNEIFTIQKQNRIAQIGQEKASPNSLALRVLPAILYGANHAYGSPASGTEATVQTISRDDLIEVALRLVQTRQFNRHCYGRHDAGESYAAARRSIRQLESRNRAAEKCLDGGENSGKKNLSD